MNIYRQNCYNCVIGTLLRLLTSRQLSRVNSANVPSRPGPPLPLDENLLTAEEAERYVSIFYSALLVLVCD